MSIEEFMKLYNIKLNEQQKEAVKSTKGKILLLAVPGSGKTTVIVSRIGYLIHAKNVNPKNILTLTYSVSAARDMKQRYEKVFSSINDNNLEFRTIHSFCLSVIKRYEYQKQTKAFSLLQEQEEVLSNIYYKVMNEFSSEGIIKEIMTQITYCKNSMMKEDEIRKIKIEKIDFFSIYKLYENYKIENKKMDFDDQLKYAYQILKTCPEILKYFKSKYLYINIDEAQDTSKIQHEIIRLLVTENLFMVGDEDQSIYKFRAAYPKALLDFDKVYKNSKLLFMETNYRSTKEIVKVANQFIRQNKERKNKNMVAVKKNGSPIQQISFKKIQEQYEYIIKEVSTKEKEIAILYRNNESAIPIIAQLQRAGINFQIKESEITFFTNKIVQDIIKILEFSLQLDNIDLFKELYYKINCGISKKMIQQIIEIKNIKGNVFDLLLALSNVPIWQRRKWIDTKLEFLELNKKNSYEAINIIMKKIGYEEFIKSRLSEKDEKIAYVQKVNILLAIAKQYGNIKEFLYELKQLEKTIKNGTNKQNTSNIYLSTIHASKGLEYETVLLVDVINGIIPCLDKPEKESNKKDKEEYEEEVRLFYVGITRAKTQLKIITYEKSYYGVVEKSQFIKELFENAKDNYFKKNQVVMHKKFGKCKIVKIEENLITIKTKFGILKKLDKRICYENGLLQIHE